MDGKNDAGAEDKYLVALLVAAFDWLSRLFAVERSSDTVPTPVLPDELERAVAQPTPERGLSERSKLAILIGHLQNAAGAVATSEQPAGNVWTRSLVAVSQEGILCTLRMYNAVEAISPVEATAFDQRLASLRSSLSDASSSERDFDLALAVVARSQQPIEAIPCAIEEMFWRSGHGIGALKLIQQSVVNRYLAKREQLKQESETATAYGQSQVELSRAVSHLILGPVTMAVLRLPTLDPREQSLLLDGYSRQEVQSLHTLLVEMSECASNLAATMHYGHVMGEAVVAELNRVLSDSGPTAARQWLRECRNLRLYPPKYQFDALDSALSGEGCSEPELRECVVEVPTTAIGSEYIVTFTEKPGVELPDILWSVFSTNFALIHETIHLVWALWTGHPDGADSEVSQNLTFVTSSEPGILNISIDGSGVHERGARAHQESAEARSRAATVVAEADHLRRAGKAGMAVDKLRRLRAELESDDGGSNVLHVEVGNALAGALRDAGEVQAAIDLYEACLDSAVGLAGTGSRLALVVADNLAAAQVAKGGAASALKTRERIVRGMRQRFGAMDVNTLIAEYNLATTYFEAGDVLTANATLTRLAEARDVLPAREKFAVVDLLGATLLTMGKTHEALVLRAGLLRESARTLGRRDPTTRIIKNNLHVTFVTDAHARPSILHKLSGAALYLFTLLRWATQSSRGLGL